MTLKKAGFISALWIVIALGVALVLRYKVSSDLSNQFLAGYFAELGLSLDNVFIFSVIFNSFRLNHTQQAYVLRVGLVSAVVLRILFIFLGISVIEHYHWVLYGLGIVLLFTAYKLAKEINHPDHKRGDKFTNNRLITYLLSAAEETKDNQFLVKTNTGLKITQLVVVLCIVELTDIVFAFDSIPAVLAVTNKVSIAVLSNVLAIAGLRALYFLVTHEKTKQVGFSYALIGILLFTAVKILGETWLHVSAGASLGVILGCLLLGYILSLVKKDKIS
jgi:tellurite resistance protein TerC